MASGIDLIFSVMGKFRTVVSLLLPVALLFACAPIPNYLLPDEPKFTGDYAEGEPERDGQLQVLSYNVQYGENIQGVIDEFNTIDELRKADIVLLQEMDEVGVDKIARVLGYNYVYYPASIHSHHQRNFGNAILTKWPIRDSQKVILPHANPKNQQRRVAVKANILAEGEQVLTYSVHTETFWLVARKRANQIKTLLKDVQRSCAEQECQYVVIGGDFNSMTPGSIADLDRLFNSAGFSRATEGLGNTVNVSYINLALDHIYTQGLAVLESGKVTEAQASDHFPLWIRAKLD